jgi:uncharacterized protein (DUF488 family)
MALTCSGFFNDSFSLLVESITYSIELMFRAERGVEMIIPVLSGGLCPVGYAAPDAGELVAEVMQMYSQAVLVDVRLHARSRWFADWNKSRLLTQWGERYVHEKRLGNLNYRYPDRPIVLAEPEPALRQVMQWLAQGYVLVLLCACADYERCHRKVIVERIVEGVKSYVRDNG